MKKPYFIVYTILLILSFSFFIYIYQYEAKINTRQYRSSEHVITWTDYTQKIENNELIISGTVNVGPNINDLFAFYSTHQNITVYCGSQKIYQFPVENMNPYSVTPGYNWNFFTLPYRTNAITIHISSPYDGYIESAPTFYIGSTISVIGMIISSNIISFILCIIIFGFGICMLVYWFYVRVHVPIKSTLLQLGLFAILLSTWSANECQFTTLLFQHNLVCSYISFITLMMLPLPFALFTKTFYEDSNDIWDVFCVLNVVQIITCFLLQIFKIADFRNTLWITHIILLLLAIIVITSSIKLLKDKISSRNVKIHLCCLCICAITLILDLFAFYLGSKDCNTFGRVGFLLYIAVLGISTIKDSASLMKLGRKAHTYQQLAYTDQMTSLSNRTAFNHDFDILSSAPFDIAIINLDLNSLKYINDNLGHTFGDTYITNSAKIISKTFSHVGKCYRVGGDEFVVIIEQASHFDFQYYFEMLDWSINSFNATQKDIPIPMQIAHGYAIYDSAIDVTLNDTYNRADKNMYENKKEKKRTRS